MVTAGAAAYVASPAWVPRIRQVPVRRSVTVSPLAVQTAVVSDVSVTAKPDDAEGLSMTDGFCMDCVPGFGSVIVCAAFVTLNER